MPLLRFSRFLPLTVLALAGLFAVLEPGPSRGMALWAAVLFWVGHIGLGMLLAILTTRLLTQCVPQTSAWFRVCAGGVLGSLCFAPLALGLEALAPVSAVVEPPDGTLDLWEQQGGSLALLAEWLQLAPSYLLSWLLINAVPMAAAPSLHSIPGRSSIVSPSPAAALEANQSLLPNSPAGAASVCAMLPPASEPEPSPAPAQPQPQSVPPDEAGTEEALFLGQLPPAIGTDVISIRSDLHYLQVRTAIGRAMLLGSIATAETALGAQGLRVHRSYWVALRHVRRVVRGSAGWHCQLSDGSRIPVSRRRASAVRERLGRDFVIEGDAAG